ncbi:hypothetical protein F5Y17DRAFT_427156 [Xylariaceae sp. FL0594]|nr:hypothetical protein F5Y17DRAFT_427156 [Xylariaceae sp. FL0594]
MPVPRRAGNRRASLAATARDTIAMLPAILQSLPHLNTSHSTKLRADLVGPLSQPDCPGFKLTSSPPSRGTFVKVMNEDTLDAAIAMARALPPSPSQASNLPSQRNGRVAVLNLASDKNPGGGWMNGALAQEEALCYRSSLAQSLHKSYYPWSPLTAVYTPDVVVVRSSIGSGHKHLTPDVPVAELPVVSVISVAAIRRPAVCVEPGNGDAHAGNSQALFKHAADRLLTKEKMRLVLRIAAREKHELLVLGALGCGAFRNPPEDVAQCWSEVLDEEEFRGGWWREIWFAVLDGRNEGNFDVFDRVLSGKEVGKL